MAEFPLAGVPVDKYGDAKTDKGRRSLLAMDEEEEVEDTTKDKKTTGYTLYN